MNTIKTKSFTIMQRNGEAIWQKMVTENPHGFLLYVEKYGTYQCLPHPQWESVATINNWSLKLIKEDTKEDTKKVSE